MLRLTTALIALIALALLAAGAAASPGFAQSPDAPPEAEPAPAITADNAPEDDARIARRITQIFSEIETLSGVTVSVEGGVATLSGQTASGEAAERAETLAARVEGVATVENDITRDVSLTGRVDPALGEAAASVREAVRALPLVGLALVLFFVIAALGWLIAGWTALWRRVAPNLFIADLAAGGVRVVFVVVAVVSALSLLDATALIGALLGAAGLAGIALGFALKDTVENYVASIMLSMRQPFRPNDHVVIDGQEGRVIRLTSRATVLMTLEGNHLRIPNGAVFKAVILNYTRNVQRRFDFKLGVDADDDGEAAARLGVETLASLPFVLGDPEPMGFIDQAGDSTLDLRFFAWIDQTQADYLKSRSAGLAAVKQALEAGGFTLPEPIYRLRFDGAKGATLTETAPASPAAGSKPAPEARRPAPSGPREAPDTRPDDTIKRRVEAERATDDAPDLLSPGAPTE